MATADKKTLFVGGGNGGPLSPTGNPVTDLERAQDVARRYRCEFIDLTDFELHHELFKKIPVELTPSPALLNRSNLTARLLGMPCGPPRWSEP